VEMSQNSALVGHPHAAADIVQSICDITFKAMEENEKMI